MKKIKEHIAEINGVTFERWSLSLSKDGSFKLVISTKKVDDKYFEDLIGERLKVKIKSNGKFKNKTKHFEIKEYFCVDNFNEITTQAIITGFFKLKENK